MTWFLLLSAAFAQCPEFETPTEAKVLLDELEDPVAMAQELFYEVADEGCVAHAATEILYTEDETTTSVEGVGSLEGECWMGEVWDYETLAHRDVWNGSCTVEANGLLVDGHVETFATDYVDHPEYWIVEEEREDWDVAIAVPTGDLLGAELTLTSSDCSSAGWARSSVASGSLTDEAGTRTFAVEDTSRVQFCDGCVSETERALSWSLGDCSLQLASSSAEDDLESVGYEVQLETGGKTLVVSQEGPDGCLLPGDEIPPSHLFAYIDDEIAGVVSRDTWEFVDDVGTFYRDADGDGDCEDVIFACEAPEGYVSNRLDCDDDVVDSSVGCGCATTRPGSVVGLLPLLALGLRRRHPDKG